ncbi:MAG: NFACT family protein [Ruminococcus sp.]|jgi:predicted ribosome quality control (RQC) complex YloA/Tae2 family protein|nr:NFACT family protein [Ruminococcus sp.]
MALDGLMFKAVSKEISALNGYHISKIYQPSADELVLSFKAVSIYICINPSYARVNLTSKKYESPNSPPMFCMLLRKYLQGAKITDVVQSGYERVLSLDFENMNEVGDMAKYHLIVEIMGRYANLILTHENYKIIDAMRRIYDGDRLIIPTAIYEKPPANNYVPEDKDVPENVSEFIEKKYEDLIEERRLKNSSADLHKLLNNIYKRLVKKIANQKNELLDCRKKDEIREKADACTALIWQDRANIDLSQKYYKEYKKIKNREIKLKEQIELGISELEYIDTVIFELKNANSLPEIAEIREEVIEQGYIKKNSKNKNSNKKNQKNKKIPIAEYQSSDGFRILVGKNNIQNDILFKNKSKIDIWLHAKDRPSAHVYIAADGREISDTAIYEAAKLLTDDSSVPIDYCFAKFVKKIPGAKPGMVIYSEYSTIFI